MKLALLLLALGAVLSAGPKTAADEPATTNTLPPPAVIPLAGIPGDGPEAGKKAMGETKRAAAVAIPPALPEANRLAAPPLGRFLESSSRPGRSATARVLVINSSPMGTNVLAEIEEDLTVMARILEKTVEQQVRSLPVKKLGLVLQSLGRERPQSFYLEGYGALFLLPVRVPLHSAPPSEPAEATAPRPQAWDQIRQELYGGGNAMAELRSGAGPAVAYDEELVAALKQQLLEALGNATRLRHLPPEEYVTVTLLGNANAASNPLPGAALPGSPPEAGGAAITGGASSGVAGGAFTSSAFGGSSFSGGGFSVGEWGAPPSHRLGTTLTEEATVRLLRAGQSALSGHRLGTTLTLRVKKADVDALAAGKLSLDEFRKRAVFHTYVGNSLGSGTAEFFMWPDAY